MSLGLFIVAIVLWLSELFESLQLAELHGVEGRERIRSAGQLIVPLMVLQCYPGTLQGALQEIISAGNAAAHGASLAEGLEDFAFDEGRASSRGLITRLTLLELPAAGGDNRGALAESGRRRNRYRLCLSADDLRRPLNDKIAGR